MAEVLKQEGGDEAGDGEGLEGGAHDGATECGGVGVRHRLRQQHVRPRADEAVDEPVHDDKGDGGEVAEEVGREPEVGERES